MNKRIRELEKLATETVRCGLNGTSTAESFNRKKFAQLIMRETFDWVVDNVGLMEEAEWNALEKHFGVECE